jgi:hypothetical protein
MVMEMLTFRSPCGACRGQDEMCPICGGEDDWERDTYCDRAYTIVPADCCISVDGSCVTNAWYILKERLPSEVERAETERLMLKYGLKNA